MWSHQAHDHSSKRNARADLDRVADQLGGGVILVKSHAQTRRHFGNVDLPRRHSCRWGLITALLATSAAEATVTAILGAALIAFGLWLKARSKERFLAAELGSDAYGSYCRRVPMLIPFLPHV
jgi:hypothetical protein